MNNPFATIPTPAQQPTLQANPFAAHVQATPPNFAAPSFPTTTPTANPFAAVVQAPPTQVHTQGVAAIQAAFAFQPSTVGSMAPAPFPPLNPPSEAGLGLQPVAVAPVQVEAPAAPVVPQEPAPKARRSRKPRAQDEQTALDQHALASGGPAPVYTVQDEQDAQDMTLGQLNALADAAPTLDSATTEELRDALNSRGWNVTLVAS